MEETQKTLNWPKRIGLGFAFCLVLGGFFFLENRKTLSEAAADLKNVWRLAPYEKQVEACLIQAQKDTAGQKVVGLEFSCAIQIGQKIYPQDPDLAMALCLRHSLIKNPEFETATRQTCKHRMSESIEPPKTGNTPSTTTPQKITPTTTIEVLKGAISPSESDNVILR